MNRRNREKWSRAQKRPGAPKCSITVSPVGVGRGAFSNFTRLMIETTSSAQRKRSQENKAS